MTISQHRNLMRYHIGWMTGAGRKSFFDEDMKDPDYKRGFEDGRKASKDAYEKAEMVYGCSLNMIKAA